MPEKPEHIPEELDDWPDEPPINELMRLVAERDRRIADLEAKNERLKQRITQLKPGWSSGFSAGYDAGYAIAEQDYGINEDTDA